MTQVDTPVAPRHGKAGRAAGEAAKTADSVADSPIMTAMARLGLVAHGFVYLLIGWLALQVAFGHGNKTADQRGAMSEIAKHTFGIALLWVLAVGLAAYAIWRLFEAALGSGVDGDKAKSRLKSAGRGIAYGLLCISTVTFAIGTSRQSQSQKQQTMTGRAMEHAFGRWLVAVAGLVVIVGGIVMIVSGARKKFLKQLTTEQMNPKTRDAVESLGTVGNIARGAVFVITGMLFVQAAITYDPSKVSGMDGALKTLRDRSWGPWILGVMAIGLIAYGIFGFAQAKWAKIHQNQK